MLTPKDSAALLKIRVKNFPKICVVLGTGWNHILKNVTVELEMPYQELFGTTSSVPGHDGKLIIGSINHQRVAFMSGRFHTYEGYSSEEVTRPIQTFALAGAEKVILTAAAGALNEKYQVGEFVILSDMITAFCQSPLIGPKFTDLSNAFSPEMMRSAQKICISQQIPIHEGRYIYVRGPHFETPADKMLYRQLGADVIGMSVVPETIMANYLKLQVLGLACVTNLAFVRHDHLDVLAASEAASKNMVKLLSQLISTI